jgi:anti-sigma factor RsiW
MTCDVSRERVHAWLDGELSVESALEAEAHVHDCAVCAAEYRSARALRAALRGAGLVAVPPESLEARVRTALLRESASPRRGVPVWAAVAAALALGAALGALFAPFRGAGPVRRGDDALVAAHVRALGTGPLIEVASSDRHTVKPWFAGRVEFSPKVRDLAADGFPLAGGRVDRIAGRPVAVLVYAHERHKLDLFVEVAAAPSPAVTVSTVRGLQIARWTEGDLAYAAVSDMEEREILAFVDLVRR